MLEKRVVVKKCWGRALSRSVEKRVVEKCWRRELSTSVEEECC